MSNSPKNTTYHEVEYPVSKHVIADFLIHKGFEPKEMIFGFGEVDSDPNGYNILVKDNARVRVPRSFVLDRASVESILESAELEIEDFEGYYLHVEAHNLINTISAPIEVPKELQDIK